MIILTLPNQIESFLSKQKNIIVVAKATNKYRGGYITRLNETKYVEFNIGNAPRAMIFSRCDISKGGRET